MWARKVNYLVLLAATVLAGCQERAPWFDIQAANRVRVSKADVEAFNEAVALTESLRYEAAAGKFRQVFDSFSIAGDRQRAAESLFWLGFCREKQQRVAEAKAIYTRLTEEYSGTRAADEAAERLSRISEPRR